MNQGQQEDKFREFISLWFKKYYDKSVASKDFVEHFYFFILDNFSEEE